MYHQLNMIESECTLCGENISGQPVKICLCRHKFLHHKCINAWIDQVYPLTIHVSEDRQEIVERWHRERPRCPTCLFKYELEYTSNPFSCCGSGIFGWIGWWIRFALFPPIYLAILTNPVAFFLWIPALRSTYFSDGQGSIDLPVWIVFSTVTCVSSGYSVPIYYRDPNEENYIGNYVTRKNLLLLLAMAILCHTIGMPLMLAIGWIPGTFSSFLIGLAVVALALGIWWGISGALKTTNPNTDHIHRELRKWYRGEGRFWPYTNTRATIRKISKWFVYTFPPTIFMSYLISPIYPFLWVLGWNQIYFSPATLGTVGLCLWIGITLVGYILYAVSVGVWMMNEHSTDYIGDYVGRYTYLIMFLFAVISHGIGSIFYAFVGNTIYLDIGSFMIGFMFLSFISAIYYSISDRYARSAPDRRQFHTMLWDSIRNWSAYRQTERSRDNAPGLNNDHPIIQIVHLREDEQSLLKQLPLHIYIQIMGYIAPCPEEVIRDLIENQV